MRADVFGGSGQSAGFAVIDSPQLVKAPFIGANSSAIQPDGKILVGGYTSDTGVFVTGVDFFTMWRYQTNGTLDTSFGTSGFVADPALVDWDNDYGGYNQIAVTTGGRILASLRARSNSGNTAVTLTVPLTNVQTTFTVMNSIAGFTETSTPPPTPFYAMISDGGGAGAGASEWILVTSIVGQTWTATRGQLGIAATAHASGIAIFPAPTYLVAAYTSTGAVDSTFNAANTTGIAGRAGFPSIPGAGNRWDSTNCGMATDFAVDANGKIVVTGWTVPNIIVGSNTEDNYFACVRYNANGSIDTAFGIGGFNFNAASGGGGTAVRLTGSAGAGCDTALTVIVRSSGKILLGGCSCYGTVFSSDQSQTSPSPPIKNTGWSLLQLNADGSVDNTFGSSGHVLMANAGDSGIEYIGAGIRGDGTDWGVSGKGLAEDSSNRIYATGVYKTPAGGGQTSTWIVKRLTSAGATDNSWGASGVVTTTIGILNQQSSYLVAIDGNGKCLVAGYAQTVTGPIIMATAICRYNAADGSLDTSFGTNGILTYSPDLGQPGAKDIRPVSMQVQADGKIVLTCNATYLKAGVSTTSIVLARFTSTGILDTTFGQPPVAAPAAPTTLVATGQSVSVALTWNQPTGGIASYTVYRGTVAGAETSYATGLLTNSYTDNGAAQDVTYYYKVTAVNSAGESPQSNETSGHAHTVVLEKDLFAGSNGVNLTAHTMDVGSGWTQYSGGYTLNGSGAAVPTGAGICLDASDAGQTDMDISVTANSVSGGPIVGICGRLVDANNYIQCILDILSGNNAGFAIFVVTAGVATVQQTYAITPLVNTDYTLRMVIKGNNYTCYLNGAQRLSITTSSFNTATKCGLRNNVSAVATYKNYVVNAP